MYANFTEILDQGYDLTMNGTGVQFDFKIGEAVANNLIIHFDLIVNTIENSIGYN